MDRLRSELIELTKEYQSSWYPDLGRSLYEVKENKLYRRWKDKNGDYFRSFSQYCIDDLHIGSTVASDLVTAYRYIETRRKESISNLPSDGKVPGYNEVVVLLRAKGKIPDKDFWKLEEMLFADRIGRDKLRQALRGLLPRKDSKIRLLEEEILMLRIKVSMLEAKIEKLSGFRIPDFSRSEINGIRRSVARFIHPDVGGDNNLMRDFNVLVDKLLAVVRDN